jgi:cytochrome P450
MVALVDRSAAIVCVFGPERLIARKRERGGVQRDAMGLLMAARDTDGSGFSEDELVAEVLELVVAGHDTSAMTMTWTLFLLDQHPDVLRSSRPSWTACSAVGRRRLPILPQLPLLDRVVKESMRC